MSLKFLILVLTCWVTLSLAIPIGGIISTESGISNDNVTLEDNLKPRGQANLLCCSEMPDAHGWQGTTEEALVNDIKYFSNAPTALYTFSTKYNHLCVPFCQRGTSYSIKICQDRIPTIPFVDYRLIANYIGAIKDGCGGLGKGYCGQQFDDRGFNVIAAAREGLGTPEEGCPA